MGVVILDLASGNILSSVSPNALVYTQINGQSFFHGMSVVPSAFTFPASYTPAVGDIYYCNIHRGSNMWQYDGGWIAIS